VLAGRELAELIDGARRGNGIAIHEEQAGD
jgi:hypothetical protein